MARHARKFGFTVLLAISEIRVLCRLEMTVHLWEQKAEWLEGSCKELVEWNVERTGFLKGYRLSELIHPDLVQSN